jgi:hypothetical protein
MTDEKGCFWCANREDMRCLDRHLDLRKFLWVDKHWDLWFSFLTDKIYKYPEIWKNDMSGNKSVSKNCWFKEFLKRKVVFVFR